MIDLPARRDHAGALDQRRRQPRLRLPGLRERGGLHLAGQQPGEPAHALVQRPGLRPAGEALYLRDEETGRVWSPTPLPSPSGAAVPRPPRPGLHAASSTARRRRDTSSTLFVPPRRPGQAPPPAAAQPVRRPAAPVGHRSTSNGCWARRASAPPLTWSPSATRPPGAVLAGNRLRGSRRTGRVPRRRASRARGVTRPTATEFLGRNGSRAARPALTRAPLCRPRRRRPRPVRRAPGRGRARRPARRASSSSCSARPRRRATPATLVARLPRPGAGPGRARRRRSRAGTSCSAPSRSGRPTRARPAAQPLAALPGA